MTLSTVSVEVDGGVVVLVYLFLGHVRIEVEVMSTLKCLECFSSLPDVFANATGWVA